MTDKRHRTVVAVERAVDVLLYLAKRSIPAGVTDLAKDLNLSRGAAHRYLTSLVVKGLAIQHQETDKYSLGPSVLILSQAFLHQLSFRSRALPYMNDLHQLSGETVSLAVRYQDRRTYVDQIEGTNPLRYKAEIGKPYHLYYGSPGKVILANLSEHEIETILQDPNLRLPAADAPVEREALLKELSQIRTQGYATSIGETLPGLSGVSAVIKDHTGEVVGTVGISGLSLRFTPEKMAEFGSMVKEAAQEISKELGYLIANREEL